MWAIIIYWSDQWQTSNLPIEITNSFQHCMDIAESLDGICTLASYLNNL